MSESGFFVKGTGERVGDPSEAPGRGRVAKLRAIAAGKDILLVEGHPVDPIEAGMIMGVYDALSGPESRHVLMSPLSILRVIDFSRRLSRPGLSKTGLSKTG